jgi:DNA polymerase III epsilon subunit-like protein
MVAGKPTFKDALPSILPLLKGAVVVGHNVRFDLWFLHREFRRCSLDFMQELANPQVMDTVRIARRRFGRGGNGLQVLCRRLGYEPPVAHRALADAITTFHVLDKMLEPIGGWGMSLCDAIIMQGGPMSLPAANSRQSLLPLELEEALEQKCCVVLEYLDAHENRTQRVIEPIEVRRFSGELVLIAHCQLRNDRRNFKVARIVRLIRMQDMQSVGSGQGI